MLQFKNRAITPIASEDTGTRVLLYVVHGVAKLCSFSRRQHSNIY